MGIWLVVEPSLIGPLHHPNASNEASNETSNGASNETSNEASNGDRANVLIDMILDAVAAGRTKDGGHNGLFKHQGPITVQSSDIGFISKLRAVRPRWTYLLRYVHCKMGYLRCNGVFTFT